MNKKKEKSKENKKNIENCLVCVNACVCLQVSFQTATGAIKEISRHILKAALFFCFNAPFYDCWPCRLSLFLFSLSLSFSLFTWPVNFKHIYIYIYVYMAYNMYSVDILQSSSCYSGRCGKAASRYLCAWVDCGKSIARRLATLSRHVLSVRFVGRYEFSRVCRSRLGRLYLSLIITPDVSQGSGNPTLAHPLAFSAVLLSISFSISEIKMPTFLSFFRSLYLSLCATYLSLYLSVFRNQIRFTDNPRLV